MNKRKNEGITLIALVITIIVMLILASVSISLTLGEDGLLGYARNAKDEMIIAREIEEQEEQNVIMAIGGMAERRVKDTEVAGTLAGSGTEEDPLLVESTEDFVALVQNIEAEEEGAAMLTSFTSENGAKIKLLSADNANGYNGRIIKLDGTLNLANDISYKNPDTTEFGDINNNGIVEGLKTELITGNGFQKLLDTDSFSGVFDGQGYEIKGINITTGTYNVGLFASNTGLIKNLKVSGNINIEVGVNATEDSNIRDTDMSGDAAEEMSFNNKDYTVQQCIRGLKINRAYREDNPRYVIGNGIGGIVGSNSGTIQNCINNINITVHIIDDSTFQENYVLEQSNNNEVLMSNINQSNMLQNAFSNINKYNVKRISTANSINRASANSINRASGNIYIGGIAGTNKGTIINCKNTGNITVTTDTNSNIFIGGIIGGDTSIMPISNCTNSGNIRAQGNIESSSTFNIAKDDNLNNINNSTSTGTLTVNAINELNTRTYISGIRGALIENENITEESSDIRGTDM